MVTQPSARPTAAALYRAHAGEDWREVDLLGKHPSGSFVVREVNRLFPGVILATVDQVRQAA